MALRFDKPDLAPPAEVVLQGRSVLGAVDLDPYSTPILNQLVLAARIYDRDLESLDSILARDWDPPGDRRVFVGPPVGAAATRRLLNKTLREYRAGRVREAILWIGHNESIIRCPWLFDFPICFPFRRIRPSFYDDELEEFRAVSPSDWSAIAYLPPSDSAMVFHSRLSRFHVAFAPIGRVVFNECSGEGEWEESYKTAMRKPYDYRG